MDEKTLEKLESVANTLRGMTMDLRIPAEARQCLAHLARDIDAITYEAEVDD
jgi:hypothetical protein